MTVSLLAVSPLGAPPHPLHAGDRVWTETNCYLDVWVEVLHALGLDPRPAGVCAFGADFQGDQWEFLKYPAEDLDRLYGIRVDEINVWRPVLDHVLEQLSLGSLVTVEVDSFHLPDTAGVHYRAGHGKTTIVPQLVDLEASRLEYWHNAGYFALEGEDFDGVLRPAPDSRFATLPPYVERIDLSRMAVRPDLAQIAADLARGHLARRPATDPVARLGERLSRDLPWLVGQDPGRVLDTFHAYAFGMLRQCGVTAQVAADAAAWLSENGEPVVAEAVAPFLVVSEGMKSLQLQVARVVRGRTVDVQAAVAPLSEAWRQAQAVLTRWTRAGAGD